MSLEYKNMYAFLLHTQWDFWPATLKAKGWPHLSTTAQLDSLGRVQLIQHLQAILLSLCFTLLHFTDVAYFLQNKSKTLLQQKDYYSLHCQWSGAKLALSLRYTCIRVVLAQFPSPAFSGQWKALFSQLFKHNSYIISPTYWHLFLTV